MWWASGSRTRSSRTAQHSFEIRVCGVRCGATRARIRDQRRREVCSHGDQESVESFFGDREVVFFENCDVEADGLANAVDGLFASASLADTARQARALGHPLSALHT